MKRYIVRAVQWAHVRMFGAEAGPGTQRFIAHIGYTGLGTLGSAIFLFAVNTVAVRALGPAHYGAYILVVSIASFMMLPMVFGMQVSLMKHLPAVRGDLPTRNKVVATAFWIIAGSMTLSILIFYIFRGMLTAWFSFPLTLFFWALAYAGAGTVKEFGDGVLKGLHQFKAQAVLAPLYALLVCIVFFSLFFTIERTFAVYVLAVIAGLLFAGCAAIVWNHLSLSFALYSASRARTLLHYGLYSLLNAPSWLIITNVDRLLMNRFLSIEMVGIYAVYASTSLIVIGRALSLFINVFFPTVAGIADTRAISAKINTVVFWGALPLLLINCGIMYLMFFVYGDAYPVHFSWIILFSVSALLYSLVHVKWNIIMAQGAIGLRAYAWVSAVGALMSISLTYIFIQQFGFLGAVYAALFVYAWFLISGSYYADQLIK